LYNPCPVTPTPRTACRAADVKRQGPSAARGGSSKEKKAPPAGDRNSVILSLLITTVVLRRLTRKYVAKPIEALNRAAEEIIAGTYSGEVRVDEGSAYAALQGLLRSGQKVLQRLDREMR